MRIMGALIVIFVIICCFCYCCCNPKRHPDRLNDVNLRNQQNAQALLGNPEGTFEYSENRFQTVVAFPNYNLVQGQYQGYGQPIYLYPENVMEHAKWSQVPVRRPTQKMEQMPSYEA